MEFRILGAFEVATDGRHVSLAGTKPRALLALLLLHANEPVAADRLIEELWHGRPPKTARKVLQTYVSRLRHELGDTLRTRPAGYELCVEPGALDADRFERLVTEARDSDRPAAAHTLREALALWRGPPLADFAYEPWAQAEIARLQQLRLTALEERIEADLAVGRDAELVGELEALVAEHPLQERLRGLLMLALYRAGRQADALAAYRDARQALVEELGIEPSPALQQLERDILKHEAELEPRRERRPTTPVATRADALPRQTTSFVGRARELEALQALMERPDVRLLTLTGPGGAGKTRLALEAARRYRGAGRDGMCFVDLSPVREAALVAGAIAEALGLGDLDRRGGEDALGSYLSDRSMLLVLDNFEQVLDAAPLVGALLGTAPAVELLATSRTPLRLREEHVYAVPPLELPDTGAAVERLAATDAVALFVERACASRPGFALTEANAAAVGELCACLDGLPLALELAAARIALLSPRAILSRLGHWLDLLKTSAPDVPERHRTLRAAIEWSYELLGPEEQTLFANLGVFVGGFTIDAAEAVGVDGNTLDSFETLLGASLLQAEAAVLDEPRFGMLETIREYALEKLAERADGRDVHRRHAVFYLALCEDAEPGLCGPLQGEWLERLDAELGNVRAGLAWSADGGDQDAGLRLGAALWRYWQVRGHVAEGREILERLLARRSGSRAARAAAQLSAARCAMVQGDFEALDRFVEASLPVHRKIGDDRSVSFALAILGLALNARGDRERALPLLEEARDVAHRSGDTWNESRAICYLGMAAAADDLTAGRRLLEEGLRGLREIGDVRSVSWVLGCLVGIARAAGDSSRATDRLEEALALCRELGDTWGISQQLEGLGSIRLEAGDHRAAAELLEESLVVARDAHYRPLVAASLESLAWLAFHEGQPQRAARLLGSASVLRQGIAAHPMQTARPNQEAHVEAVRLALGEPAFEDAWADGRAMTLDEAVAYALEGSSPEAHIRAREVVSSGAMPTVRSADAVEIAYRAVGNDPPTLLFMHGWAGSGAYFDTLLEQLDLSRMRAVTVDLRGHGESGDSDDGYTLDGIAADTIAVADAVGAETFVLVGFSMSGRFVQYISCLHPDRVLGQILVAGAFATEMALPPELLEDWYGRAGDPQRLVELEQAYSSRPVPDEVWEAIGRNAARVPLVALQGTMDATISTSFADRLSDCRTPTLVVGGADDGLFSPDALRDGVAAPLPNARVEILACGHGVPVEQPRELARLIESFLAELG